jgi:hypothetical protein
MRASAHILVDDEPSITDLPSTGHPPRLFASPARSGGFT